jgi:hypothetical protein
MRKSFVCAVLAAALLAGVEVPSAAMPKLAEPSLESPVQSVVCIGDRRNYRNFDHCWRVISKRIPKLAANYCSRICRRQ